MSHTSHLSQLFPVFFGSNLGQACIFAGLICSKGIVFALHFHIVYSLCILVAQALAVFFSLPVIGWVFSAVCWIVDHTLTSLPSFDTILDEMRQLAAEGSLSGLAGRVMYAMDGGSWGAYLKILPDYVSSFVAYAPEKTQVAVGRNGDPFIRTTGTTEDFQLDEWTETYSEIDYQVVCVTHV